MKAPCSLIKLSELPRSYLKFCEEQRIFLKFLNVSWATTNFPQMKITKTSRYPCFFFGLDFSEKTQLSLKGWADIRVISWLTNGSLVTSLGRSIVFHWASLGSVSSSATDDARMDFMMQGWKFPMGTFLCGGKITLRKIIFLGHYSNDFLWPFFRVLERQIFS